MELQELGSLGELVSGIAVLVTLIYLARQIRQQNKQALQQSLHHTFSSMNEWSDRVAESDDLASIIVRGRASFSELSDDEQLRFEMTHLRFLNILEIWFEEIGQTYPKGSLRDQHLANLKVAVDHFFGHPGTFELWPRVMDLFPPDVRALIEQAKPIHQ
jgi:hypothetical protein